MWPFGPHRHHWVGVDGFDVARDGKKIGFVYMSRCFGCSSFRYDRLTGDGHESTKIVDASGKEQPV